MTDKSVGENVRTTTPDAGNGNAEQRVAQLIEQLKQRRLELEAANRELRHISHYRSLFLARMSHELRTPLTSILGFTEILLDQEELTDPQQRFCQKIRSSGMQLLTSLNQLVDLSRLEVGPAELFLHEFPLNETLRDACDAVERFAQKSEVKVHCEFTREGATIVSDEGRLRQVLYTFLAWAVSRSSEGQSVVVTAALDGPSLLIHINDEGRPVKDLSSLFEPDDAEQPAVTDLNEMGIIVGRRLLEVMNGGVKLEQRDGGGIRTALTIPVSQSRS